MTTLVGAHCILKVQLTTIEVGPGLASSHPDHHHWGWPWIGNFLLFLSSLPYSSFSSLAAPPAGIQSDSDPKWSSSCFSPPVAAMERSKVICSIQVWGRDLGLSSKVSLDFAGLGRPCSWAPLLFLLLDVALYNTFPPADWRDGRDLLDMDLHCSLHVLPFLPRLSWVDLACTGDVFAMPTGEEHLRGIWVSARCMPSSLVSRGFTKPWVGQVALRSPTNRHALDLLFHWTIKATRNEFLYIGSMVPFPWSAPSSIEIPALRVPRYRLAPVDCFSSSFVTGKAPC